MTPARAIELAFAETIKRYAEVGAGTVIRAWHNMNFGGKWKSDPDQQFPFCGVSSSPAIPEDNQVTCFVDTNILCATWAIDDKDHEQLSAMEDAVQSVLDKIFAQFRSGDDSGEFAYLNEKIDEYSNSIVITTPSVSLTWLDPQSPSEDNGANVVMVGMRTHFARTDF